MNKKTYRFLSASVDCFFNAEFKSLEKLVGRDTGIIITDENVFASNKAKFKGWNVITLKPGEEFKVQPTADAIIEQLIKMQADRRTVLIGVGGGVITDLTGYVASVYMRGVKFGFVPTSVLAMVDASIGGKNGIDVGKYKNLVGVIRQPSFLFYDLSFLKTLPLQEWSNGFAEIVKHACILDRGLFSILEKTNLAAIKTHTELLEKIILRNIDLKSGIVKKDEYESGDRKLLNFGHTLGHALETQYELTHGQAISLGMVFASWLSAKVFGFSEMHRVEQLLVSYGLPTRAVFDLEKVFKVLLMDKKRISKEMSFVLLEQIGKGNIKKIDIPALKIYLREFNSINKKS